jgi:hypothetical protein
VTTLAAPFVNLGFCNPYGAETGGPRHVMGGLHGPQSATTPDMGLPVNVEQGEWACPNRAEVRAYPECRCGHKGQPMNLCSWHEETTWHGEMVGQTYRRVKSAVRVRGHFEEMQRRMLGACLRCMYPGQYAEWYKALYAVQGELAALRDHRLWHSDMAERKRQQIEDIVAKFDEGNAAGTIHRCPMRLIAVS